MSRNLHRFRAALCPGALALALAAGPAWAAPPALASSTCAACHGADGNSADPQYPRLAGQKRAYLRLQLEALRSGRRPSTDMHPFAQDLTDAQIAELARYYSGQRPAAEHETAAGDERRGSVVFRSATRPSCAACHTTGGGGYGMMRGGMMGGGMMGGGMMTDPALTPTLFGQHATYLAAQLDAFATGARPSSVMGPRARSLSPADRKAVADYLSHAEGE